LLIIIIIIIIIVIIVAYLTVVPENIPRKVILSPL
jgi:uncharacterized membrane protein